MENPFFENGRVDKLIRKEQEAFCMRCRHHLLAPEYDKYGNIMSGYDRYGNFSYCLNCTHCPIAIFQQRNLFWQQSKQKCYISSELPWYKKLADWIMTIIGK